MLGRMIAVQGVLDEELLLCNYEVKAQVLSREIIHGILPVSLSIMLATVRRELTQYGYPPFYDAKVFRPKPS